MGKKGGKKVTRIVEDDFGNPYIEGTEEYRDCLQRGTDREGDPQWVQSWYRAQSPEGEEITISFAEYPDDEE